MSTHILNKTQQFLTNAKPEVTYRQTPQKRAVAADENLSCNALVWIFVFSMKKCTRKPTTQSYLVKNMASLGRLKSSRLLLEGHFTIECHEISSLREF